MTNLYKKELKIIINFALEYRLSLKNICKLMNINPSEENQKFIYDEIIRILNGETLRKEFRYLVYETSLESEHDSSIAYKIGKLYFMKYQREIQNNNNESQKKAAYILYMTDIEYKKIRSHDITFPISNQNALILTRYRIKHVISKESFNDELEINRDTISKWESNLSIFNPRIGKKIDCLNEFNRDMSIQHFKKRIKK